MKFLILTAIAASIITSAPAAELTLATGGNSRTAPTPQMEVQMAAALLKKAGITVTLCEMPRAGDGVLAAELARSGVAQVHGLAMNAQAVDAARKPAQAAHLLGMQVNIETGSPAALPMADWEADLRKNL